MNPQNNWRRIGGVVMVATLALFAGACSKDNNSKSTTTTTAKGDKTDKSTPSSTAKALSDEAYSAKVDEISTAITGAGTDLCKLSTVTTEGPPEPTNPKQTEAAVGLYVELLNAVAGAFPAESAASSESLRMAANTLQTEAEAAGYPTDFLSGDAGQKALSGDGYTAAMTEYQSIYQAQCAPAAPTDPAADPSASTVPAG
ncbi:MAG: hypothetical protein NTX58_12205 [Actinobacteria bacterium]|nr:hypothetical protein [Actinomycetota bacterium]